MKNMELESSEQVRTRFAAERTLLAWIRTGLALMGFGFVVARFGFFQKELASMSEQIPSTRGLSIWIGVVFVTIGILVNLAAGWEHLLLLKTFQVDNKKTYYLGSWVALLLALMGVGMLVYLLCMKI